MMIEHVRIEHVKAGGEQVRLLSPRKLKQGENIVARAPRLARETNCLPLGPQSSPRRLHSPQPAATLHLRSSSGPVWPSSLPAMNSCLSSPSPLPVRSAIRTPHASRDGAAAGGEPGLAQRRGQG